MPMRSSNLKWPDMPEQLPGCHMPSSILLIHMTKMVYWVWDEVTKVILTAASTVLCFPVVARTVLVTHHWFGCC